MGHRPVSLETIVKQARDGEYGIPEFQRGFVWNIRKVCDFADSLVRGFPVGSILTWESDTAAQRGGTSKALQKSWLIDGQQRATALCSLFGHRPEWWDDKRNGTWNDHIAKFDIKLDIGTKKTTLVTGRRLADRYVSFTEILTSKNLSKLAEKIIEGGQAFTNDVDCLKRHLENISKIKKTTLPIIEIDDTIKLAQVAEIFKRLNSNGTNVQQSDVYLGIVAFRKRGWVNENFLDFLYALREEGFDIGPAFLFRSFTAIGAKNTRFRTIPVDFWESPDQDEFWDATQKALRSVCEGLRQYGIINSKLTISLNAVVAAAIYRDRFPQEPFGPFVAWMLLAIRDGFFAGSTESNFDRLINSINSAKSARQALKNLKGLLSDVSGFDYRDFRETGSGRNSIQRLMIYLLAYANNARDWDTKGYRIRAEARGEYSPEWHHIFPRKWLKDNVRNVRKELIDSVANMAVISSEANRKIAAKSPGQYIAELDLASRGLLKQQAIPDPSGVTPGKYRAWLRERAELLAEESNKYLSKLEKERS